MPVACDAFDVMLICVSVPEPVIVSVAPVVKGTRDAFWVVAPLITHDSVAGGST